MTDAAVLDKPGIQVHEALQGPGGVAPFEGVIGVEGLLTGDGRLIAADSLQWATFPLPLRYAAQDFGGHDGAIIVGRIDRVERRDNGDIYAWGVLDLGSEHGQECARLMRGQFLSGVSMDLDSVDSLQAEVHMQLADGEEIIAPDVLVTQEARVRAATLVAIPAFDEARLALVASMGGDSRARKALGHGAFSLAFESEQEMNDAFFQAKRKARFAQRRATANLQKAAVLSPRARRLAALAAERATFQVDPEKLASATATFAYDPLQWRDPANGKWIDMPGLGLEKWLSSIGGIHGATGGATGHSSFPGYVKSAQTHADQIDRAMQANDIDKAQSIAPDLNDDLLNIQENFPELTDKQEFTDLQHGIQAIETADSFEVGDSAAVDVGDAEGASFDDPTGETQASADDAAASPEAPGSDGGSVIPPGAKLFDTDMSSPDSWSLGDDGHLVSTSPDGTVDFGEPKLDRNAEDELKADGQTPENFQNGEVYLSMAADGSSVAYIKQGDSWFSADEVSSTGSPNASSPASPSEGVGPYDDGSSVFPENSPVEPVRGISDSTDLGQSIADHEDAIANMQGMIDHPSTAPATKRALKQAQDAAKANHEKLTAKKATADKKAQKAELDGVSSMDDASLHARAGELAAKPDRTDHEDKLLDSVVKEQRARKAAAPKASTGSASTLQDHVKEAAGLSDADLAEQTKRTEDEIGDPNSQFDPKDLQNRAKALNDEADRRANRATPPTPEEPQDPAAGAGPDASVGAPETELGSSGVTLGELQGMSDQQLLDLVRGLLMKGGDAKLIDALKDLINKKGLSINGSAATPTKDEAARNKAIITGKGK